MVGVDNKLSPLQKIVEVLHAQAEEKQFSVKNNVLLLQWIQLLAKEG